MEGSIRMLVLSRKTGERIHIGNDIFVEVRRVAGNRVTLAIKAPREVRILRGELMESTDEFSVLDDEPLAEESAKDTVIMKHVESESRDGISPSSMLAPIVPASSATSSKVHAK